MSESSDRLEDEFAEITRCFSDHPQISIVSTDGSPVNQYVIEYRLNGLVQLDDGEIVQSDQHRIEISLSFGFPHFPPNCRPLTKIFHPDMDPSAIKIAEFWASSTSLTELILHVGKMVCWEEYSSEDGFNQAALDWLKVNKDSVPMDTINRESDGAGLPDVDLELSLTGDSGNEKIEDNLGQDEPIEETSIPSFVDDLDFNFSSLDDSSGDGAGETEKDGGLELDCNDSETSDELDLGFEEKTDSESSFVDEIDFDVESSSPLEELDLSIDENDAPLELTLENEDIKPVDKEDLSFVAAGDDENEESASGDDSGIVLEQVAIEEPDLTPSFPVEESTDVDLDLAVVDVDYDILKGMIDQRNYMAAQTKLSGMVPENISKASAVLGPMVDQRIVQANGMHTQAKNLEAEGLLEDAANKLEAVLNLVQDYPHLEQDMKRVRDAWAGISAGGDVPTSNMGLERSENVDVPSAQVRDTMLTETVVSSVPSQTSEGDSSQKSKKKLKVKKDKGLSFVKQKQNKPIVFAALGLVIALCVSGWIFFEWHTFSTADQKWGEINSLLEKKEYEQVQKECAEIQELLSRVKIIKGGGKKELIARVDDLLQSEHFQEGLEGKVLWQGQYISKKAYRAYEEIDDLVEEAERRGALSKWQDSVDLYSKAFDIAKANKKRLNEKFYNALELDVKNAQFANLVSLGKKLFISTKWPQAIEKFEAALQLASEDGVADPSISYDVNRYLQRAWFSQYVIDGDEALKASDYNIASGKFTKAYAIAKNPNLIDEVNRDQVLIKLNQSSLIKIMDDAEKYVAEQKWKSAVKSYTQAKKYTMDGYPLIDTGVLESQRQVERLLVLAIVGKERETASRKYGAQRYMEAEAAYGRIIEAIDGSPLGEQPAFQKIRTATVEDKDRAHLKAMAREKIAYLKEHYKEIISENFTGVSLKALSNVNVEFLNQEGRALNFKIQCREQRESKYYTLELIYQYDIDLNQWGFPVM